MQTHSSNTHSSEVFQCRNPNNEGQLDLLEHQEDDSSGEGMDYTSCADSVQDHQKGMHVQCACVCCCMFSHVDVHTCGCGIWQYYA